MDTNIIAPVGAIAESATTAIAKTILVMIAAYGPGIITAFVLTAWAKHAFPLTARGKKIVLPVVSIIGGMAWRFAAVAAALVTDGLAPKPSITGWFLALEIIRGCGLGVAASLFYMLGGHKVESWMMSKIKSEKK